MARAGRALALAALCALLSLLPPPVSARLDKLRQFRVECFPTIPCVMGLDREKMFGCGQCTADSVVEEPIEFSQVAELVNFITNTETQDRRFLLVPDFLFFRRTVLSKLPFAENVAGVVVFPGLPRGGEEGEGDDDGEGDDNDALIETYSVDDAVPNRAFTVNQFPYNALNQTFADRTQADQFRFYPFNIFRVSTVVAARIRERVTALNNKNETEEDIASSTATLGGTSRSGLAKRYVLQSNGRMYACPADSKEKTEGEATLDSTLSNSTQCLKDRTCLPIGGQSVWSSLGALQAPQNKSILAVTAPMDSTAFFHDVAQGAAAEVSSLATLMAVAEAVGAWRRGPGKNRTMLRQPVYFAWNAQAWGFAGSSRFLMDVENFECEEESGDGCARPYMASMRFKDLKGAAWSVLNLAGLIDPQQSGQPEDASKGTSVSEFPFYWHAANVSSGGSEAVRDALQAAFGSNVSRAGVEGVPPDASLSFSQYLPEVESVSLANYESSFTNRLWHSQFDNVSLIPPTRRQPLITAANGVARTIISLCFGDDEAEVSVNRKTIDGFVECFTSNWSATPCELSKQYQGVERHESAQRFVRATNYAGIFVPVTRATDITPGAYNKTDLVNAFLAFHNRYEEGSGTCDSNSDCVALANELNDNAGNKTGASFVFCVRRKCVASDTFMHDAYGTAIDATDAFGVNRTSSVALEPQFETNAAKTANTTVPESPQYTESYWDPNLGLCGLAEDSRLFGIVVLIGGVGNLVVSIVLAYFMGRSLTPKKVESDDGEGAQESEPIAV